MLLLLASISLLLAAGSDGRARRDAADTLWRELKELLPAEYVKAAEDGGLSGSSAFQGRLLTLTYQQVVQETEALAARQQILQEYVNCACPTCPEHEIPSKNRPKRGIGFAPARAVTEFQTPCDSEDLLKTIKLLRENLVTTQLTNQQLALRVACNCPHADKCRSILDPLVYSIISGQNDTELYKIFWQHSLKGFPQLVERSLVDSLTGAASSILGYVFQNLRPNPATQKPNTPKPTTPKPLNANPTPEPQEPESPSNSMKAPPAPPSIFAPGQDPLAWQYELPAHHGCPEVHVNINNSKQVHEKKTADVTSNSTPDFVEEPLDVTTHKS